MLLFYYPTLQMIEFMKGVEEEYKIKITFSVEEVPLGTAGPLILAKYVSLIPDCNCHYILVALFYINVCILCICFNFT